MMELVQYFASHIGETIISFNNRQSDTGDDFFSGQQTKTTYVDFVPKDTFDQCFAASA